MRKIFIKSLIWNCKEFNNRQRKIIKRVERERQFGIYLSSSALHCPLMMFVILCWIWALLFLCTFFMLKATTGLLALTFPVPNDSWKQMMVTEKYPPEDLKLHLGQSEGELSGKSPRWLCWGDHEWIEHWCCLVHRPWGSRGWHTLPSGTHWGKWICRKMSHLKKGLLRTKRIMG